MTQWILVSDDNESDPFDDRDEAVDEKETLEALGADIKLREVGDDGEPEDEETDDESDDVDANVIEMSGYGGNTDTDDDGSNDVKLIEDGGTGVLCPACNRISTRIYRCDRAGCGHDLAGETVDEWGSANE